MRCGPAALLASLALLVAAPVAPAQVPLPPPFPPEYLPPVYNPPPAEPAPPPQQQPVTAYFSVQPSSPCVAGRCTATVRYDNGLGRPVLVEVDWTHRGAAEDNFVSRSSTRCLPESDDSYEPCRLTSPAYRSAGSYVIALRVTDDAGQHASSIRSLRVFSASVLKRRVPSGTKRRPGRGGGGNPLCAGLKPGEQCGAGSGRQTVGGGDKVSHKGWPAVTGILWKVTSQGRGHRRRTGGPDNDELLGHHGSDRLNGGLGDDILWGDWDPKRNNTSQRDTLRGGPGDDWLYPSHGTSRVYGGAGSDYVWAFYGRGTIDCGPGHDKVRVRLNTAFSLHNCEQVEHFCGHGSDGHGGCLKPGEKPKAARPR